MKESTELKKLITWQEDRWGSEHYKVLATLEVHADLAQMQDSFGEAEPIYWQILEKKHKLYGANDLRVADTIRDLASLHEKQENWSECERLYLWAFDIRSKLLPPGDPSIIASLDKVKEVISRQGRDWDESELPVAGFTARNNLDWDAYLERARLLLLDRNYDFAATYLSCLVDVSSTYSPDTREQAECLHLLGLAQFHLKSLEYSLIAFEKALAIYEKVFGTSSAETAKCLEDMADLHCKRNSASEAQFLLDWALQILESLPDSQREVSKVKAKLNALPELCSESHADSKAAVAATLLQAEEQPEPIDNQVPSFLWNQYLSAGKKALSGGDFALAEDMIAKALTKANEFGYQDPRLWRTICDMASVFSAQGKRVRSESMYKYALELCEKTMGQSHPDNSFYWEALGRMYEAENDNHQAKICYDRLVTIMVKAGKPLVEYALFLKKLEKLQEKAPASFFE